MSATPLHLRVDVGLAPDADAAELDGATRELRSELLELDVDDVEAAPAQAAPDGARVFGAAIVGTLAVHAAKELIGAIVRTASGWVGRRPDSSVKLTIGDDTLELSGASDEEQARLVELFLARHAAPPE